MQISIQKEDLLYAVTAVERAISTKNTLPTLGGIMIKAEAGRLSFRATDMEMAIECVVPAQVEEDGEVVAPGRKFSALVRLLPAGQVNLYTVASNSDAGVALKLKYAGSQLTVPCFPVDEFPLLPQPSGEIEGRIAAPAFRRIVRQVSIATAADEVRPVFTGVMTEFGGDTITMAATDTHRLTRCRAPWEGTDGASLLIPVRTLQEIARLAANDEDFVTIRGSKNQVFFSFGQLCISTRVIMGQYPDYRQVIPEERLYTTAAVTERSALINSLERAQLVAGAISRSKGNLVRMEIRANDLTVAAEAADEGMIREPLPLTLEGEELDINYNARYLLDVLRVLDEDQVLFRLTGSNTPGLILPASADPDHDDFLYLLLPVRVSK